MTSPTNIDFDGMPVVYSAIFTAVQGATNPQLEPNHPYATSNPLRARVPKGISTIQVSTNYSNKYEVVHQETLGGTAINTRYEFTGGGVLTVRSLGDGATLYIRTFSTMPNSTDNWGLIITNFRPA